MSWFKRKRYHYSRREVYLILQRYILDCLGNLPEAEEEVICARVQKLFGGDHNWKRTVRGSLHLPESIDEEMRQMWIAEQQKDYLVR